jgi:hypothetical protein
LNGAGQIFELVFFKPVFHNGKLHTAYEGYREIGEELYSSGRIPTSEDGSSVLVDVLDMLKERAVI